MNTRTGARCKQRSDWDWEILQTWETRETWEIKSKRQFDENKWVLYLPLLAKKVCRILLLFSCLATSCAYATSPTPPWYTGADVEASVAHIRISS